MQLKRTAQKQLTMRFEPGAVIAQYTKFFTIVDFSSSLGMNKWTAVYHGENRPVASRGAVIRNPGRAKENPWKAWQPPRVYHKLTAMKVYLQAFAF